MTGVRIAGAKPRHESTLHARRVLLAYLSILLIAALALAGALPSGSRAAKKELAVIACGHQIKRYCEQYTRATEGVPAASFAAVEQKVAQSEAGNSIPTNPYTGVKCTECNFAGGLSPGDFSYLLILSHGQLEDLAIVVYSPRPSLAQRCYSGLLVSGGSNDYPDLSLPGPDVVWIGGECGNNYEYLSRGLAPQAALVAIKRVYKIPDSAGADAKYTELEVVTPQEYAARLSQTPLVGAGGS